MNFVRRVNVLQKVSPFLCGKLTPLNLDNILIGRGNRSLKTSYWLTKMASGGSQYYRTGNVEEVFGDLFTCPDDYSMAHCISSDIKMGKGIAVIFKKMFGGVNELWNQNQRTGGLAILERDGRYIYYLVTKERYWEKPTYDTLTESLIKMRDHNVKHGVRHVAMPEIGCGLDKLKWPVVLQCINNVYKDTDVQIRVYHYDDGKKKPQTGGQWSAHIAHDQQSFEKRGGRYDDGRYRNDSRSHGQRFSHSTHDRHGGRHDSSGRSHGDQGGYMNGGRGHRDEDARPKHHKRDSGHSHRDREGSRSKKESERREDRSREGHGRDDDRGDRRHKQKPLHHSKERHDEVDCHRHQPTSNDDDETSSKGSHHDKCDGDDSNSSLDQQVVHEDDGGSCDGKNSESYRGRSDQSEPSKSTKSRDKHPRVQDRNMSGKGKSKGDGKNKKITIDRATYSNHSKSSQ